ncbi:MAG: carboxypeptidase regulatory-like domain-containing protein [Caldilineales bacterium]|nr:carboxypeptidase regulatory-like domain-containing protein [Caldilineales bacterium]
MVLLAVFVLLAGFAAAGAVAASAPPASAPAVAAIGDSYKIVTTTAGVYQVTHAALTAAGFDPTGIATSTFQLFHFGQEVALVMRDGGDGSFDSGDSFLFYAQAMRTRYTTHAVYWFVAGEAARALPGSLDGTPAGAPLDGSFTNTLHFEQDVVYRSSLPMTGDDADRWYWRFFQACAPGSRTCNDTFGLKNSRTLSGVVPAVSSTPFSATLTITLRGASNEFANPDHHVKMFVNGVQVGDSYFEGMSLFTTSYTFDSSLLLSGANTFRFDFPDDLGAGVTNQGYINSFDLEYEADFTAQNNLLRFSGDEPGLHRFQINGFSDPDITLLDITDPLTPALIANGVVSGAGPYAVTFQADNGAILAAAALGAAGGAQYAAVSSAGLLTPSSILLDTPSNLKDTDQGADYLVITPAIFAAPSQQLADYRALANGFRTRVVDVQDIYDEFNSGLMNPSAIRDFIIYATHEWQPPRPRYVVLMGDGHYDFLNFLGSPDQVFIPPWLAAVDPFQGETAADNRYVDIFGNEQYDSDAAADFTIYNIELVNGQMVLSADFGFIPPVAAQASAVGPAAPDLVKAIGDMVFWDEDGDHVWDANERGMPGVTVELLQGGSVVATTFTDEDGKYFFENLSSGVYQVHFVLPSGWQFVTPDVGDADPATDQSSYDSDADPITGLTPPITYTYPETFKANWDAGLVRPGTIGNRVWQDSNGNGLQDAGEPGIPGVTVELLQGGSVISTTMTAADGYFHFFAQPDGVYALRIAAASLSGPLAGHTLSPRDQGFDTMPDLSLGRFPVNTLAEASEMVNRTINYETASPSGDWQKRVIYVADDPDTAGNFHEHSNEVADHIWPYPAESQKIYYKQNYATTAAMKAALIAGIDQGAVFVTYNGHSSKIEWGGGDRFFTSADINALSNTIFPVFLPMTCLEGQYINPGSPALGEVVVRTIGKGAVASFSPTGLGVATGHQFLYNSFFEGVVSGFSSELGDLTNYAKYTLFQSHSLFKDLLDTYVLFGDPALAAQIPGEPQADPAILKSVTPAGAVQPGDTLTYTLTYSNAGEIPALNTVITDLLPAGLLNPTVSSAPPLTQNPGPNFSWNAGDLDPGEGGVITITAVVDLAFVTPGEIVNTAVIAADGEDANPLNNQSTVTTPVQGLPGAIAGVVFRDPNANGILDPDELGRVPDTPITATLVGVGTTFTTLSDSSGNWTLTGLPPGQYEVTAPQLLPGLYRMTPTPITVNVPAGGLVSNVNIGYIAPTAVTLAAFEASAGTEGVRITWRTADETALRGFYVWRSSRAEDHGKRISPLIPAGADGYDYGFTDASASGSGWFYWLEAAAIDGPSAFFGPIAAFSPDASGSSLYLGLILR